MKMVGGSARGQQQDVFLARDPADVLPEPLRISDEIGPTFCAEYAMHQVASVGVSHASRIGKEFLDGGDGRHITMFASAVPTGLGFFTHAAYPAMKALG